MASLVDGKPAFFTPGCTRCPDMEALASLRGGSARSPRGFLLWGAFFVGGATRSPRGFFFGAGRPGPRGIFLPKDDGIKSSPYRSRPCSSFFATRNSIHDTAHAMRPSSTIACHHTPQTALAGDVTLHETAIPIQKDRHAVQ